MRRISKISISNVFWVSFDNSKLSSIRSNGEIGGQPLKSFVKSLDLFRIPQFLIFSFVIIDKIKNQHYIHVILGGEMGEANSLILFVPLVPIMLFFFLVISPDIKDGKLQFRYKARMPEIVRSLICFVPLINILSNHRQSGESPFTLFVAIGLLTSPFAIPVFFAPKTEDAFRIPLFAAKWMLSKLEALLYGVIIFIASEFVVSAFLSMPNELLAQLLTSVFNESKLQIARLPSNSLYIVLFCAMCARFIVVVKTFKDSQHFVIIALMTILSFTLVLFLLTLALVQIDFQYTDWKAPVGGTAVGIAIAIFSDISFKRDIYITRQKHGRW